MMMMTDLALAELAIHTVCTFVFNKSKEGVFEVMYKRVCAPGYVLLVIALRL